jgi:hypothetical protein
MHADLKRIAEKIGELYAAARYDFAIASPDDIGFGGVPIKTTREAYVDGCKDMAQAVCASLDAADREEFTAAVREALDKHERLLAAA